MKSPFLTQLFAASTRGPGTAALLGLLTVLTACDSQKSGEARGQAGGASVTEMPGSAEDGTAITAEARLAQVLEQQPDRLKDRYTARKPAETLAFFGLKPGMTVVEATPEGGWYTRILLPYLGSAGRLIGADYSLELYEIFDYYSEEELAEKATWAANWSGQIADWNTEGAVVDAFNFGSLPPALKGQADAVLFIRALHNLSAYETQGAYLSQALGDAFNALKPGGVVGVVQHMGPESASDTWSNGDNGYLKKSRVIADFEAAGFLLDGDSFLHENPMDKPGEDDGVWRLPPTLEDEDPVLRERYEAVGESTRMMLRFRKPV